MAVKDITDLQVCKAIDAFWRDAHGPILRALPEATGQPEKVCWRAIERACLRDLIDYGSSLNVAFLTDKGKRLIAEQGGE